jgi:hypothetical protein
VHGAISRWVTVERSGSYFRGRPVVWNPRARVVEEQRQRWVSAAVAGMNDVIADLAVDPAQAYEAHRAAYVESGDMTQLGLMLEYVTA